MKDEILSHLHDILQAGRAIKGFIAGCTFDQYSSNRSFYSRSANTATLSPSETYLSTAIALSMIVLYGAL